MKLVRMAVAWGMGSETYDFYAAWVSIDENRNVVKWHWGIIGWLKWKFGTPTEFLHFGHGYQQRDYFSEVISKQKPMPKVG